MIDQIEGYINNLIEEKYNIYHDCFFVIFSPDPFCVRIIFNCFFSTGNVNDITTKIVCDDTFTETEIREMDKLLTLNSVGGLMQILQSLDKKIFEMIKAVEDNHNYLQRYKFQRHFTKTINTEYSYRNNKI